MIESRHLQFQPGEPYDPRFHWIHEDNLWVQNLRDALDMPDLFVYGHFETGGWFLAKWKEKPLAEGFPGGLLINIKELGGNPDWHVCPKSGVIGLPTLAEVIPLTITNEKMVERITKMLREKHKAKKDQQERNEREKADVIGYLRRKAGIHRSDNPRYDVLEMEPMHFSDETE